MGGGWKFQNATPLTNCSQMSSNLSWIFLPVILTKLCLGFFLFLSFQFFTSFLFLENFKFTIVAYGEIKNLKYLENVAVERSLEGSRSGFTAETKSISINSLEVALPASTPSKRKVAQKFLYDIGSLAASNIWEPIGVYPVRSKSQTTVPASAFLWSVKFKELIWTAS